MNAVRRPLGLWDLIFYGIVLIQPIAPVPLYGVAQQLSNGHFATIILIAMVAMMITAVSYGRMAAVYPSAGSAYTYVGRGLNHHVGFLIGWAMFLDYLLQPLINTVWISQTVHARYLAAVPFEVWAVILAVIFTLLNVRGIKTSALTNRVLLIAMIVVVVAFVVLALKYIVDAGGVASLLSAKPFYDPATFDWKRIWGATSFAALTYIGFDGITTLTEDARDSKRDILRATVLVCAFTGIFSALLAYLGSLVWPNWHLFKDLDSAFMDVASRVGGGWLFNAMGIILIVAAFGSALTGALGAAKLLFGMGRDGVLPRRVFGYTTADDTPTYNLIIVGLLTLAGAVLLNRIGDAYEHAGEILNFGAFLAFMGVNLAAFWHFTFIEKQRTRNVMVDTLLPMLGFIFCAAIWWNLNPLAKTVGGIWIAIGALYLILRLAIVKAPKSDDT